MTEKSLANIKGMLQVEAGPKIALCYIQGRAMEAGDTVIRRAGNRATEAERQAALVAALRAMRDEIEATIKGLEEQP